MRHSPRPRDRLLSNDDAAPHGGEPEPHVLLLTGAPGVGKTTVVRRVAARPAVRRLRGFYTEEIREGGARRGFRLVSLEGKACVIAHVALAKGHRVGKYGVDVAAVDDAAALIAPDPAAQAYLVDEIGKMECLSERFVTAVRALLAGRTPVVATVGLGGHGGFIAEVKGAKQCLLWEVTHANREALPSRVAAWLAEARSRVRPGPASAPQAGKKSPC